MPETNAREAELETLVSCFEIVQFSVLVDVVYSAVIFGNK